MTKAATTIVLAASLAACATDLSPPGVRLSPKVLENERWVIGEYFDGVTLAPTEKLRFTNARDDERPYVYFNKRLHLVAGALPCKALLGDYSIKGERIVVTANGAVGTGPPCPDHEIAASEAIAKAMSGELAVETDGGGFLLRDVSGQIRMKLRRTA